MTTEKRFIDANAADVKQIFCYYDSSCDIADVQEWLNEQPTVDAVKVVHGAWIQDGIYNCCSICNSSTIMPHLKGLPCFNYCPNCGAKMDLEEL